MPEVIPVVGHGGDGVADPRGDIEIIVRDLANQPLPNSLVQLDFSNCPEVRLCADPHDPAAIVNCAGRTLSKVTDVYGVVHFRVVGCSVGIPGQPGAGPDCARAYADGVLMASPSVSIFDLTGCDGVDSVDLAAWIADFFSASPPARGDYDGSGEVTPSDLSELVGVYFEASSLFNCSPGGSCPP